MTGLDHEKQTLVGIGMILTDNDLNVIAESPDIVINQSEEVLNNMEDWSRTAFARSGLINRIRESKICMEQAEDMDTFLEREAVGETCPLAGNSVHFHRRFIMKYMPRLEKRLQYRIVDVSTIKELAARWYPNELKLAPSKKGAHSALNDIRGSIEELRYYRSSIFKGPHGW
uniref:Exonuclease domain-containing protein n=1 Tax=Angiostrongylus cantonensis TaxID=6313 RepID=A0A0K0DM27_ANGCA